MLCLKSYLFSKSVNACYNVVDTFFQSGDVVYSLQDFVDRFDLNVLK